MGLGCVTPFGVCDIAVLMFFILTFAALRHQTSAPPLCVKEKYECIS